ncbi:MAG: 3-dehydroquinate synthase [Deltaproteobacteria bacterium]
MEKIAVNLGDKSYEILVGRGLLSEIPSDLKRGNLAHAYAVITDSNIARLYGEGLAEGMKTEGLRARLISFPAGEEHKTRKTKAIIEDEMLAFKMARDSCVVALGGGVAGDIAGFVAATFGRGIPYVQAPTTLLAAVDSSIGGKTGVDTHHGKNLIGAFHQPWRVYIDVETLRTLPEREIREGLAETIKYGVISDGDLFDFLDEGGVERVFALDADALIYIIKRGCEIKGGVVEQDEREANLRKILNFGHTVGHAVENLSGYTISHGRAISIGMAAEGRIAAEMGFWSGGHLERLIALLKKAGLPTDFPTEIPVKRVIEAMKLDKKARGGKIEMTMPKKLGAMADVGGSFGIKVDDAAIERTLV